MISEILDGEEEQPMEFEQNPSEQRWWRTGDEEFAYRYEVPDNVILESNPEPIPEEDYLGVEALEYVRVMAEETGIDPDNFLEEVYDSNVHPVHKWQISQVVEDPTRYAVQPSSYDGAPEPVEAVVDPEVTEAALEEYVESRGVLPGTSMNSYIEDRTEEKEETLDPEGFLAL